MKNFIILGSNGYLGTNLLTKLEKQYKKKKIISISRNVKKKNNYKIDLFKNYNWFRYINNDSIIFFFAFENNLYLFEKNFLKITKKNNRFLLDFFNYLKKKTCIQKLYLQVLYLFIRLLTKKLMKKFFQNLLHGMTLISGTLRTNYYFFLKFIVLNLFH